MRRRTGLIAATVGITAAATAAGVAAERRAVRRAVGRARRAPDPYADEPFGALHTRGLTVTADDGVALHVEVEEQVGAGGDDPIPLTVVFVHGFTLSMDCWHFQRRDLRDLGRLVFYDQRSHGASGRSPREHATIDQLGRDLQMVLTAAAPTGPVVLVGHSMGGMSVLALADQHPELFGSRIVGVALIDTAAGAFADTIFGIPGVLGRALRPVTPGAIKAMNRRAALLERGRTHGSDLAFVLTRWISYGGDVPPSLVAFMERMVAGTSVEVMTEFFDTFLSHDKLQALDALRGIPTLLACGDRDVITPVKNTQAMAEALPDAELQLVPGAGHMLMLEHADLVNEALRRLVERARNRHPVSAPSRRRSRRKSA
ncbi:MAG TPA: alpha/beta hydrolase [Mycobacteriales bacterium]|nr:alpha/beta hydrolase [Mycobacteriales bacterium]